jgi:hypothetical protein
MLVWLLRLLGGLVEDVKERLDVSNLRVEEKRFVVLHKDLVDYIFSKVAFDVWCCKNCTGDCKGADGYTEVCGDVGLVDFDFQVDKRADAFFKLNFANSRVNLATVL